MKNQPKAAYKAARRFNKLNQVCEGGSYLRKRNITRRLKEAKRCLQ